MWGGLKKKLYLGLLLLVFLSLVCLPLFSEENPITMEDLEGKTEIELKLLVIDYDNTMQLMLNLIDENDQGIMRTEIYYQTWERNLTLRENDINERESLVTLRENEYGIIKDELKSAYWRGFRDGSITFGLTGLLLGGFAGYAIGK